MSTKKLIIIIGGIILCAGIFLWWFFKGAAKEEFVIQSPEVQKEIPVVTESQNEVVVEEPPKEESVEVKKPEEKAAITKNEEKKEEETKPTGGTVQKLVSFGYETASGRKIDTIVLHSSHSVSGDPYDVDAVIALWKSYGVAPHYMVARDGTIYQLVADKNIAYHAGDSKMPDGRGGVNDFSIGVEILNTKTDDYTNAQYSAVKKLISSLEGKYGNMKVVGHDTIASGRKTDPWNFDWDKL